MTFNVNSAIGYTWEAVGVMWLATLPFAKRIVRSYDGAHAVNEMHRHNRGGAKAAAESFHAGTLGEGMRAAIVEVRAHYQEMIDAWRAT